MKHLISKTSSALLLSFLLCTHISGCARPPASIKNIEEAHQKLKEICEQDLAIVPIITAKGKTTSIYAQVAFDLIKFKIDGTSDTSRKTADQKRQINFFETTINSRTISIHYDITHVNAYQKNLGYTSTYSDEFSTLYNGFLIAINRSFGDLDQTHRPNFIALFIVNINDGVGVKNIFHYLDLKKYLEQSLPQEEFVLRYTTEITGNKKFINNPSGLGLNFEEITWPEFITKQITYRINFKYTRSDFPPTDSDVNEIMSIINDTVNAYNFEDFETIELNDLASGETFLFNKGQLKTFQSK